LLNFFNIIFFYFFFIGAVEGDENGYDEEYPLESLELNTNDFMAKVSLGNVYSIFIINDL
jgi:hypothetical protein